MREEGSYTKSLALPRDKTVKIRVLSGQSQGTEFDVSRPLMTVGRLHGGADIEIDDLDVSRSHCAIEVRRDAIFVQDLQSTNGTYIDNSRIFSAQLEDSSVVRIGNSTLQIKMFAKT